MQHPLTISLGNKPRRGSIITCPICGREFYAKPSRVKFTKFCSRDCQYSTTTKVQLNCKSCGKPYLAFQSQIKHRGSAFCSRKCHLFFPQPKGRVFAVRKDGDKSRARARVHHLYKVGVIPHPNTLPCSMCGKKYDCTSRHEYHHHMGYAAEHWDDVVVVCIPCHRKMEPNPGKKGRAAEPQHITEPWLQDMETQLRSEQ